MTDELRLVKASDLKIVGDLARAGKLSGSTEQMQWFDAVNRLERGDKVASFSYNFTNGSQSLDLSNVISDIDQIIFASAVFTSSQTSTTPQGAIFLMPSLMNIKVTKDNAPCYLGCGFYMPSSSSSECESWYPDADPYKAYSTRAAASLMGFEIQGTTIYPVTDLVVDNPVTTGFVPLSSARITYKYFMKNSKFTMLYRR